ncbi:glutamine-hydrolyzing GMP synthase [bacterium]|nr:glutamine-hydrolyzing GMP synthase [bacterium]
MNTTKKSSIFILDFGSQYTQLIARRIRENSVYSEIFPFNVDLSKLIEAKPNGIILSGGPSSTYQDNAPKSDRRIFELGIPVLGICYGLQLLADFFEGTIKRSDKREYGKAILELVGSECLFKDIPKETAVWMSHGDCILKIPENFKVIGKTSNSNFAAIKHAVKDIYGIQFHPEVTHTDKGMKILQNFIFDICKCEPDWTMESFIEESIENIRETVGDGNVLLALSGGVDSSVASMILDKAIGKNLFTVFVDNGLLRKNEAEEVSYYFKKLYVDNFKLVDASFKFLNNLVGITDPEEKRKIIGKTFIEVFEEFAENLPKCDYLAQGTLYPDVIESLPVKGPSDTIKTHHNVGGLPDVMKLKIIEPFRFLFKDEVRKIGLKLHLPEKIVYRHPFPGPGLAVRIIGEVTPKRIEILRNADAILRFELDKEGLTRKTSQGFAILVPIKTVGVKGDLRSYENLIAIRVVVTEDFMTADWAKIPYDVLGNISNRICNEVAGVNRVVYDITTKPPGTIEWE